MTTFQEVIEVAARQLDERGLLLDRQLEQWVGGDAALLRQVRQRLMAAGVAQDRFGMGLARVGMAGACLDALQSGRLNQPAIADSKASSDDDDEIADADEPGPDAGWWVMSNGNVMGPWTIRRLVAMRTRNELLASDLLRRGPRGLWLKLEEVSEIKSIVPRSVLPATPSPVEFDAASLNPPPRPNWYANAPQRSKLDPEIEDLLAESELTSQGDQASATLDAATTSSTEFIGKNQHQPAKRISLLLRDKDGRDWTFDSLTTALSSALPAGFRHLFGRTGKALRRQIMAVTLIAGAVIGLWWNWPPSSRAIFNEFEAVHQRVGELKLSRKPEAVLANELASDRERIQRFVNILERRATDKPSIDRELLLAGRDSLLVALQSPRRFDSVEMNYALHIKQAALMLDGRSIDELSPQTKPSAKPASDNQSAADAPAANDPSPK